MNAKSLHVALARTLALALPLTLAACSSSDDDDGGGGGGGGTPLSTLETEPNDTAGTANALTIGRPARGSVAMPGDIDYWSFALGAGDLIEVRLSAIASDQAAWSAGPNFPSLAIWDTDGTTLLRSHDFAQWFFGLGDLDFGVFRAPAAGTYYVSVTQADQLLAGGEYAFVVEEVDFGTLQVEAEVLGSGSNDLPTNAEPLTEGVLRGFHEDGEIDWFTFTTTAPGFVRFEVWANRNGVYEASGEYSDLLLSLNEDPNTPSVLQDTDDVALFDPIIEHELALAGTYLIAVVESFSGDSEYFLSYEFTNASVLMAETEPNDTTGNANQIAYGDWVSGATDVADLDVFSFAGTAGDVVLIKPFFAGFSESATTELTFELLGPDGITPVPFAFDTFDYPLIRTFLQETGTHYLTIGPDSLLPGPSDWFFRIERASTNGYETEPNDDVASANDLDADGRAAGVIETNGDVDLFAFTAQRDEVVRLEVFGGNETAATGWDRLDDFGSELEPVLTIRDDQGVALGTSELPANPFAEPTPKNITGGLATVALTFVVPADGTYYVEVGDATGTGAADRTYVVRRL